MFSFAGHKIHGLLGSGALVKEKKIILEAQNNGGGQENNLRSGTNTLALSASLAKALRLVIDNKETNYQKVSELRDYLVAYLKDNDDKYILNSDSVKICFLSIILFCVHMGKFYYTHNNENVD